MQVDGDRGQAGQDEAQRPTPRAAAPCPRRGRRGTTCAGERRERAAEKASTATADTTAGRDHHQRQRRDGEGGEEEGVAGGPARDLLGDERARGHHGRHHRAPMVGAARGIHVVQRAASGRRGVRAAASILRHASAALRARRAAALALVLAGGARRRPRACLAHPRRLGRARGGHGRRVRGRLRRRHGRLLEPGRAWPSSASRSSRSSTRSASAARTSPACAPRTIGSPTSIQDPFSHVSLLRRLRERRRCPSRSPRKPVTLQVSWHRLYQLTNALRRRRRALPGHATSPRRQARSSSRTAWTAASTSSRWRAR